MVEKVPEFSTESLCLRQGMATSGRWCHMTLLDHVIPVGEKKYLSNRFTSALCIQSTRATPVTVFKNTWKSKFIIDLNMLNMKTDSCSQ